MYSRYTIILRKLGDNPLVKIIDRRLKAYQDEISERLAEVESIAKEGKTASFADVSKFQYRVYEVGIAIAELKVLKASLPCGAATLTDDDEFLISVNSG